MLSWGERQKLIATEIKIPSIGNSSPDRTFLDWNFATFAFGGTRRRYPFVRNAAQWF